MRALYALLALIPLLVEKGEANLRARLDDEGGAFRHDFHSPHRDVSFPLPVGMLQRRFEGAARQEEEGDKARRDGSHSLAR